MHAAGPEPAAAVGLPVVEAVLQPVPLGRGEISRTGDPAPRPAPAEITLVPADERPLRAQCWQEGVKIIDQTGLRGLALNEALKQQTLTFQGVNAQQPRTLILPLADALCLIQPDR